MIIHGDGRTPDEDLVALCDVQITDPPYSEHVHQASMSSGTVATGGPRTRDIGYDPITDETRRAVARIAALVPRWTVVHCDLESTHLWRQAMADAGVRYVREVPWVRWAQPQISGDRPCSGSEAVLHFHSRAKVRWNGTGGMTHYDTRGIRGSRKRQGQKPIGLVLTLVSAYSDPGECVYDGHAGAGTTALACRLLGRECVSYETDATWAGHAQDRELAAPDGRDRAQIREWCDATEAEARRMLEQTPEGPARLRAQARLDDVARLRSALE